ncbi:MAG: VWA domain-containing protein [Pyrinomonadaceae bacterium]|nr:VWA domain-containing protein [Pyrinomonadaceae bacterium]
MTNQLIKILVAATAALFIFAQAALCQQDDDKSQDAGDVLRINTELVQTNITVLDKKGRFVDGLKKEDFELRVDGRPVEVSFFENVLAGSRREQLLRSAKGEPLTAAAVTSPAPSLRRRTIVFFLDDLHLSLDSLGRTRKMLLNFIEKEMGENDMVAIASSSGQIGFLQQYTDNKDVLRAAVSRLVQIPYAVKDTARGAGAVMTEYMALVIERRDDPGVFNFFVQDCLQWAPRANKRAGYPRQACEQEVKNRARLILLQSGQVVSNTYRSLETLLRSAERMPGSKLAFFISDGFLADSGPRGSTGYDKIGPITDEARRAGVVIYTIDARGLVSNQLDATNNVAFDPEGRLANSVSREVAATQDALNALAADTGGRALRNQNYFDTFIGNALEETARYYLLAWRPEIEEQKNEKFKKIEVQVKGRPELTVRTARGFFSNRTSASIENERVAKEEKPTASAEEKKPDADLRQALTDFYTRQALPLQLSLFYLDTPASGTVLTSSVQAPTALLSYGSQGTETASLTLAGVILNEQGKPAASFKTGLKVNPPGSNKSGQVASNVIYNNRTPLKPGLYQVRVAARDDRSGTVGSSMQWIMIPDLSRRELSLSSLILGIESLRGGSQEAEQIQWSVDKKFAHGSHLRFMTFIYNAARASSAQPSLSAQVQIYRDGKAVISTPFKPVTLDAGTDPSRIPFTADINLGSLQAGRYVLRVNVEDNVTHKSVSQQTAFDLQ